MEAYAAVPPDDPFAASKGMFAALAADLASPAAAALTACGLEELLDGRGREVLRQALQDHYDLRAAREEQQARERRAGHEPPVTGPGQIARTRLETGHSRLLATLFGTVRVTRCAWRAPGALNLHPA
ncbi:MAG: ISKra4 family transposase, partial [Streptosporangiaceae bacterium]